jgi:hypothetical protein
LTNFKNEALFEVYFSVGQEIYRVVNNGEIEISIEHRRVVLENVKWVEVESQTLSDYFYSIAINYSIYGLNEKSGPWLGSLFHKNDGYQTPLVINPYRQNGNINVNNEYHLAQSRTLSNLKFLQNFELIDNRQIEGITFSFDPLKTTKLGINSFKNIIELFEESQGIKAIELFKNLYKLFFQEDYPFVTLNEENVNEILFHTDSKHYEIPEKSISEYTELESHLIKYVIFKIFKLVSVDIEYNSLFGTKLKKGEFEFFSIKNTQELLEKISTSKSHLTLKIRQVIFSLKSRFFAPFEIYKIESNSSSNRIKTFHFEISISVTEYIKRQKEIDVSMDVFKKDVLELVPVAYAKIDLFIYDFKSNKGNSPFFKLSSGEQQLILTLQTIYYHLYNLNSVESSDQKSIYNKICIILDEIELYFHPEYQRKFIYELINGLKKLRLSKINAIQILFSTHSPFILSDIPSVNILRLKEGMPESELTPTFGANIHQLLYNDFYLESGFIGEYAKLKINEVVDYLNVILLKNKQNQIEERILQEGSLIIKADLKIQLEITNLELRRINNLNELLSIEKCKEIINLIGEPILSQSLNNLYSEVINLNPN